MASYTVTRVKNPTLVASTVDTLTAPAGATLLTAALSNRSNAGVLWYRTDGTAPTVAGDDCDFVLPLQTVMVSIAPGAAVKVICATANDYSLAVI